MSDLTASEPRTLRDLDVLTYQLGLSRTLADDGNSVAQIAAALKLAAAAMTDGCGAQVWCEDCFRHVPHGRRAAAAEGGAS